MMEREWRAILARYGQPVTVYQGEAEQGISLRAFLQPVLEKGTEQSLPSPLGMRREDRFLYLGPGDVPLTARESRVAWAGRDYEVQSAQSVGSGNHWWAVLRPRDEAAV